MRLSGCGLRGNSRNKHTQTLEQDGEQMSKQLVARAAARAATWNAEWDAARNAQAVEFRRVFGGVSTKGELVDELEREFKLP